ncbi:MAG: histidine phosphatase family protein [Anaerolineae bacterium]|nr:histidine phosphatase family protein [Anaerolineae bacterium]
MPVTRVHIIRHGETTWNNEKRWQGHLDIPLSERGIQQAKLLAQYLKPFPITAVYTSDLQRAELTGKIIADALGLQPHADPRLREMNLGVFQGLTMGEIQSRYAHELHSLRENWLDHHIQGGETRRMMQMRAYELFEQVLEREEGPEVALVAHGGVVRVLLHRLFPDSPAAMHTPIENTSLTTVTRDGGRWHLERLAETPHLTPHMPPSGTIEAQ